MNHTRITKMWLHQHWNMIKNVQSIEELKAFVWKQCKPLITNEEAFIKGQRLVNYAQLYEMIELERNALDISDITSI